MKFIRVNELSFIHIYIYVYVQIAPKFNDKNRFSKLIEVEYSNTEMPREVVVYRCDFSFF